MICKDDNCIFIHIPKVAGQSIESVFLERAGLSWSERDSFLLKPNKNPKLGPPRLAHLTAEEYVKLGYLNESEFNSMFRFAFVRNPWERLVSEYIYRKYPYTFHDFLFKFFPEPESNNYTEGTDLHRHIIPQSDFLYNSKGELLVDFIGRFENLSVDFAKVTKLITGHHLTLPHKNKSNSKLKKLLNFSKKNKHYSEFYNKQSRSFVENLYRKDIELFGYEFDNAG